MKTLKCWLFIFLSNVLGACSIFDPLTGPEQICVKYPTPESRADCVTRQRQVMSEFKKEQEQDAKAQRAAEKDAPAKPNGLCFKRQQTGELVCPN